MKTVTIFGTRPEAIKMAPVVKALQESENIENKILVTAQHREMLDQVLRLFQLKPDFDLDIMKHKQSLTHIMAKALEGIEKVLTEVTPDLVLVHGDTSTTLAGALAAYYQKIPVGHVEAGLRTYDKYQPFPEELNRHLTGVIADLHFAPTGKAKNFLLNEGVDEGSIFVTGNTVIDALLYTANIDYTFEDPVLKEFDFDRGPVMLLTAHRRENWGQPLEDICYAVKELVENNSDLRVIYPVHLNPRVREVVFSILGGHNRILLIEPLDYLPFVHLMKSVDIVLTDSGGIQEEAPSLNKPVLVLRNVTERPEAVEAGTVKVVGTDREKIYNEVSCLLNNKDEYNKIALAKNPFGDGKAAGRIVKIIEDYFRKS
nr:UDP-N-acetylglucosamine 2-epimerase (non-hydrolyzing) [Halothermothrix orenii]